MFVHFLTAVGFITLCFAAGYVVGTAVGGLADWVWLQKRKRNDAEVADLKEQLND